MLACFRSIAARCESSSRKRARIGAQLDSIRARKRSYLAQLDALNAHTSPADSAALYARGRLLELIAREVSKELDLLDLLDELDGLNLEELDRYGGELHTENELEAARCF